jgi:glutathione S-transferase
MRRVYNARVPKPELKLVVANKNYSSWSMRPWVAARQARIPFEEILLDYDADTRVIGIERYSPTRKVPVLLVDGEPMWDSLAICETLAELYPEKNLWPEDAAARRAARSVCAEMHSGFQSMRNTLSMNIRKRYPGKGRTAETEKDIARVVEIWTGCRKRYGAGGELLFGAFTIADAYYAPVAMRFLTYGVELPAPAQAYADALRALPAVREWVDAGRDAKVIPKYESQYG